MSMNPQQAFTRALALSHKYTDDEIAGGGAIKGKNCIIKSITTITGGHRVTFEWTLDNGTVQTDTMDVMDGSAGDLEDITDVDIDNLADGQILQYNATSGNWENVSPGSVDTNLGDLNDVDFDNLTDGQIIIWDATNHKWVNSNNSPTITVDDEISSSSENPVQNKVIKSALDLKVDKVNGKGLSTNDFDATEKGKLDGLANIKSIGSGLNLNSSTGELTVSVDDEMSNSSTNPVQNKVITTAVGGKTDKVASAVNGNLAGLDANGNLTDSGYKIGEMTDAQWLSIQNILS